MLLSYAAAATADDPFARGIGFAALVLAALSIGLTYFLWYRSGPHIKATVFVRAESGTIHIEVSNTGRLGATVKNIELRDHLVVRTPNFPGPDIPTLPTHRWTLLAPPNGASLQREIPPSGLIECDVEVKKVIDEARNISEVTVSAWAQRGDGKWVFIAPRPHSLVIALVIPSCVASSGVNPKAL